MPDNKKAGIAIGRIAQFQISRNAARPIPAGAQIMSVMTSRPAGGVAKDNNLKPTAKARRNFGWSFKTYSP